MARLFGAGSNKLIEEQSQHLDTIDEIKEEPEYEQPGEVYTKKLEQTITKNNEFFTKLKTVQEKELDGNQLVEILNDTKENIIHPFLNPKTSYYQYKGLEICLKVDENHLGGVEVDGHNLLKL